MRRVHRVKSWPEYFRAIANGKRTHDLRRNDRNYEVGDLMLLEEFDPATNSYSGERLTVEITSMTSAQQPCAVSIDALNPDFCILSIRRTPGRSESDQRDAYILAGAQS